MHRRLGRKKLAIIAPVLLSWTFLCGAFDAMAQGAPNEYQIGLPPYADFSGTDFDSVQLNNGNLHIEIPLWNMAGRGPYVNFKYVYDSLTVSRS